MRQWNYFAVEYKGQVRFETLNREEAENFARSLWARDGNAGQAPTLDEYKREGK